MISRQATDNHMLNAIIVDDEPGACKNLKNILTENFAYAINIPATANSTKDAEPLIQEYNPDAIFLDISMPGENAFQFLERIGQFDFEIIFTTGFDHYAVNAFKLNAIDYLLKPVHAGDLNNAIQKLKERVHYKELKNASYPFYSKLLKDIKRTEPIKQIILKHKGSAEVVNIKDVFFIEAHGSYSNVHYLSNNTLQQTLMSYSIAEYEELLPEDIFFRIHRSYLVNRSHISRIIHEENPCVMVKDIVLPVGRRRHSALISYLKETESNGK
jgi:two-component system LytT family response regulator